MICRRMGFLVGEGGGRAPAALRFPAPRGGRSDMSPRFSIRPLATLADRRLAELAATGDERAFEALIRRHRVELERYCWRLGLPDHHAEDVLQQAFTRAWMALRRGSEVGQPRAWLYRIVHNAAQNAHRSARLRTHESIDAAVEGSLALAPAEDLETRLLCDRRAQARRGAPGHAASRGRDDGDRGTQPRGGRRRARRQRRRRAGPGPSRPYEAARGRRGAHAAGPARVAEPLVPRWRPRRAAAGSRRGRGRRRSRRRGRQGGGCDGDRRAVGRRGGLAARAPPPACARSAGRGCGS